MKSLDAWIKISCLFVLLAAVIMSSSLTSYSILIFILLIIIMLSGLPPTRILSPFIRLWRFFILIFLMNAFFFSTRDAIYTLGIITLSYEGIIQGAETVFALLYVIILSGIITGTTSPLQMATGFEKLLLPLKLIRIPVEDIAMILSIALRFVPTLLSEMEMIKKAQTARGALFESKKLRDKIQSYLRLLIPVFVSTFGKADELATAMEARGYRNAKHRTKKKKTVLRVKDYLALGCSASICILIYFIENFFNRSV